MDYPDQERLTSLYLQSAFLVHSNKRGGIAGYRSIAERDLNSGLSQMAWERNQSPHD